MSSETGKKCFKELEFSHLVNPICLPESPFTSTQSLAGNGLTVQGWASDPTETDLNLSEIDVTIK